MIIIHIGVLIVKIKSLKESSLEKYKGSCQLIIILGIISSFFSFGLRGGGDFYLMINLIINIVVILLAIVIIRTKSKTLTVILILIFLSFCGISILHFINYGSYSGGFPIISLLVSFNLYSHLTTINRNYDEYSLSFTLKNEEEWEKIKSELKNQYIIDGYKETINRDNQFKLKKDDIFYVQISRNKLKCNINVVGTKKPNISLS